MELREVGQVWEVVEVVEEGGKGGKGEGGNVEKVTPRNSPSPSVTLPNPPSPFVSDTTVDSDLELLFPESYVESTSERIRLYRELDEIRDEAGLEDFARRLSDRFGEIPMQSLELLEVVRLRWIAMSLGVERIMLKNEKMVLYFVSNPESGYYQSPAFTRVLDYVQKHPRTCSMKENNGKLTLTFTGIGSMKKAVGVMEGM